jgi:hypothetical protein
MSDLFDGVALTSISHPGLNADMTGPTGAPTEIERAKELLRRHADSEDIVLGAITLVQSHIGVRYWDAVELVAEMVRDGFLSEADQYGQRTLL